MGIVPICFDAGLERNILQSFADLLPYFDDPLIRNMTPRSRSFDGGALEYVGKGGVYAVLCQSFVDDRGAMVSTVGIVDATQLDAMAQGALLQPDVSLSSCTGTAYPGIQSILVPLAAAVERRLADHAADPDLQADFDWCVAIERRSTSRRGMLRNTEMVPTLAHVAGRQAA